MLVFSQEHLRRHTGETPFHCTDCPLRFKTRNTYKRHLMTRHAKLLTANGITVMPPGEFVRCNFKVRGGGANGAEGGADDSTDGKPEQYEEEGTDVEEDTTDVEEDDEEIMDELDVSQQQQRIASLPAAASSSASVASTSTATPSPDTPAANKLLQFCAQVVNQMGQVMPPSQ